MRDLSWRELQLVAAKLIAEIPVLDGGNAMTIAAPMITNDDGSGG